MGTESGPARESARHARGRARAQGRLLQSAGGRFDGEQAAIPAAEFPNPVRGERLAVPEQFAERFAQPGDEPEPTRVTVDGGPLQEPESEHRCRSTCPTAPGASGRDRELL